MGNWMSRFWPQSPGGRIALIGGTAVVAAAGAAGFAAVADPTISAQLIAGGSAGAATAVAWVVDRRMHGVQERQNAIAARAEVLRPVPEPFDAKQGKYEGSPVGLLRAERAVVPFWGRKAEREALTRWVTDPAASRVVVVTGPPGAGKSRLVHQWMSELPEGWVTGLLAAGRAGDAVRVIAAAAESTVVVIDDADVHPDLRLFLERLAEHPGPTGGPHGAGGPTTRGDPQGGRGTTERGSAGHDGRAGP